MKGNSIFLNEYFNDLCKIHIYFCALFEGMVEEIEKFIEDYKIYLLNSKKGHVMHVFSYFVNTLKAVNNVKKIIPI